MKKISIILFIVFTVFSCSNNKNKQSYNRNILLNDTITTSSGLKYIFLKEGKGRKIEIGSKVKAYYDLYLNDADTIFESTSVSKDSIFEFIHGNNTVIDGFVELNNYLVEGDEVIAIIPSSLAYGEEGSSVVPSNSTLLYNPYIIKYVPEPKVILSDTLYTITVTKNAKDAISFYEKIVSSDLKNNYHIDDFMISLMKKTNEDSLHSDSEYLASYFTKKTNDPSLKGYFIYWKCLALEGQGKINEAITLIESLIEEGNSNEFYNEYLQKLKGKLDE